MKKNFRITNSSLKPARFFEATKYEIRKYIHREQKKILPEKADYWAFDCRFGRSEADAEIIHVKEINKYIDEAEKQELESFYLEILAKPVQRKNSSTNQDSV